MAQSHTGSQSAAIDAVPTNASRQDERAATPIAIAGAIIAPSDMPTNSVDMPRARSSVGSARWTICAPAGNVGDSATPSATRSATSAPKPGASAWSAATTDHTTIAHGSPRRAPVRSTSAPARGPAARYAIANADPSHPYCASETWSSFVTVGASTASVCRST